MFKKISAREFVVLFLIFLIGSASAVSARPMPQFNIFQPAETTKLPPVNWIRSRTIDIRDISIDLRFDWEKDQAIGSTVITLAPFADTDRFPLDAASMTIESVALADGTVLKYNYDGKKDNDNLEVLLGRIYPAGEDIKVKVSYRTNYVNTADSDTAIGSFGRGLRFIKPSADDPNKPRQIWSQGESEFNRYWFPSYDTPNDFRTTELRATVDKPFTVVSNGKLVETKENADNTRTFHWKMDVPYTNYLTSIVVGDYKIVEQNAGGIPVYNYGYTTEAKEVAATVKNLPDTIKFFSEITGVKYPYAKYAQTFVEDFGGGMENISATTQIEEMIHDERELLDTDSESLQSHELAHQWFGDYVTCRDWGQIWLNESFATYMQAMWDERLKGHDEFLYSDIRSNQNNVLDSWKEGNRRPIVTKYYANKDAMFDNYAYPGGGSVLHMLRKHLGDKLFYKSLNNYLTTNAHQPVSTEDLRIAVEESSGQSMDWFFDQWLYRMGHPIFEITQSYDDAAKKLTLNVKQTQKPDLTNEYPQVEFFQSKVDVEIDGRVETVWLKPQAENVFTFDSAAKPKLVNFDYEGTLLKEMKFEKSVDDLIYQLQNDKDVLGRRWALSMLEQKSSIEAIRAIKSAITNDKFWGIRRDAVEIVTSWPPPPAPAAGSAPSAPNYLAEVVAAAKDTNNQVRISALRGLATHRYRQGVEMYLANLSDRSYGVIDASALALAKTGDARAYDALLKLTNTPSWKGRIQIAAFNGLAELGDKRAFDIGYKTVTDKNQPLYIRTAAASVIGATGKGNPRAYPLIFEQFKKAYDANNTQSLINSVEALIQIADPRGQEAFDMLKTKYKDNPNVMQAIAQYEAQFKAAIKK